VRILDDFQIDDDPARVDRDALWRFLSIDAYWGRWRSRDVVERQVDSAWRVVAGYDASGAMIGFARAVSDGCAIAWLADVYVIEAARGRGLGKALVEEMVERGPGRDFRWLLSTQDAHGLYRSFGFREPDSTIVERPAAV
jgi:GNAT superfamily N-acetyltransferase